MLWADALDPCEGSLTLLSPPFGIWKLPPALAAGGVGGVLVGGEVGSEVGGFDDVGFWEGTAPFGTCGVTLGLMCDPLAGPEGVIGLGMFEDLADSEEPGGFSFSFLFVLAMMSVRDQEQILARLGT